MRAIASFIMRGPAQAVFAVVMAALLPVLSIISGAPVALVTLRRGPEAGLFVALAAAALVGLLMWLMFASTASLVGLLGLLLPLWLLAVVLRYTVSLATTLQAGVLISTLVLLGYMAYLGDVADWGRALLDGAIAPLFQQAGLSEDEQRMMEQVLDYFAPITLGLLIASSLSTVLLNLLLGRWWQAMLFNPGGFRTEFQQLRLGRPMAILASVVFAAAWVMKLPLFDNLVLLMMVVYALQGIAVVHGVVDKAKLARFWLVGFYVLMLFVPPHVLTLVSVLGIGDAWVDFRGRVKPPAKTS